MNSSKAELLKHFMSGVSGHIHREQVYTFTTGEGVQHTWNAMGHACDMRYVEYVKGPNWVQSAGQLIIHPNGDEKWESIYG